MADFNGTFNTNWGPVTLQQQGTRVTGSYKGQYSGDISGDVTGDTLNFEWKQPDGQWGKGVFKLSPDGAAIQGTWGAGNDSASGGEWKGTK